MKRSAIFPISVIVLYAAWGLAQNSAPPDTYKPTLDRLEALTRESEPEWRFHDDVPHPEDPGVSDADWGVFTVKNVSGPGGENPSSE